MTLLQAITTVLTLARLADRRLGSLFAGPGPLHADSPAPGWPAARWVPAVMVTLRLSLPRG